MGQARSHAPRAMETSNMECDRLALLAAACEKADAPAGPVAGQAKADRSEKTRIPADSSSPSAPLAPVRGACRPSRTMWFEVTSRNDVEDSSLGIATDLNGQWRQSK